MMITVTTRLSYDQLCCALHYPGTTTLDMAKWITNTAKDGTLNTPSAANPLHIREENSNDILGTRAN